MSPGEAVPQEDLMTKVAALLEKLPASAGDKIRRVVDAWIEVRKKLKKDPLVKTGFHFTLLFFGQ